MRRRLLNILIIIAALAASLPSGAAGRVVLSLGEAVRLANDSSLMSFRYQNLYASGYWEWRNFRANRLPSLTLDLTPARYSRSMIQRYDSQENIDVFRAQQMYSASAGLSARQNVDFLGGSLYLESDLEYLRNFGDYSDHQYSSIPIRIGYRQDLIGFNQFRWERRIEPVKYEKVRRQFIYNMEAVSEAVVTRFFALALAQSDLRLAQEALASADTLYTLGERRFRIASISQAELLTLRLDKVNAENSLENARIAVKRAQFALASYLGMDTDTEIEVVVPASPSAIDIPVDLALSYARENNPEILQQRQTVLEAERDMARTRAESLFNASVNASVGFNQVSPSLGDAYRNLLRQDLVSVTLSIPLVDWGIRKGKYRIAKNALNVAQIAERQQELDVEQEVVMTISDFNTQQRLVASAVEALDLADMAYSQTRQRFIIGKADISSLTLSHNRQQDANKNYISSLQNYWLSYFKIRKLTLHDFELGQPLSAEFDRALGLK